MPFILNDYFAFIVQHSLEAEKTWLQCQCERWGLRKYAFNKYIYAINI